MKELTIEQKAKAYDKALESMRDFITYVPVDDVARNYILSTFPELKESEDERIKKAIIEYFESCNIKHLDWIAWLEKQGLQKPVWGEEDEEYLNFVIGAMKTLQVKCTENEIKRHSNSQAAPYYAKVIDWLKFLRPQKQGKPTDEQIKTCKEVYADILSAKGFALGTINNELNRLEEQLKKL